MSFTTINNSNSPRNRSHIGFKSSTWASINWSRKHVSTLFPAVLGPLYKAYTSDYKFGSCGFASAFRSSYSLVRLCCIDKHLEFNLGVALHSRCTKFSYVKYFDILITLRFYDCFIALFIYMLFQLCTIPKTQYLQRY